MASTQNIKTFYRGQVVFREGQESNVAYLIKKGEVTIYRTVGNKKVVLDRLGEGEIFGEMGIISPGKRSASAEASAFCELVVLTDSVLYGLLKQCPRTVQFMTKVLIRRLRKATALVPERDHTSTFLSLCHVLHMMYDVHLRMTREEQQQTDNYELGLDYFRICKKAKSILLVSQIEIDTILKRLDKLKVIEVSVIKSAQSAFSARYVRLADPDTFLDVAANIHKELQAADYQATTEFEYVDIEDFAREVGTTPEMLYKKLAQLEVPETLFFFHRKHGLDWAEKQEPGFFQTVRKRKKKPGDFDSVNDIVHTDNQTLKDIFAGLGYYKVGVLLSMADDEAAARITANLPGKMARIVREEAERREHVDESEAADIEEELIEKIKLAKGVA